MSERTYENYEPAVRPAPEPPATVPTVDRMEPDRLPARPYAGCSRSGAVERFAVVSAVCCAIWLLTGAGYFWPIWVILGTGIPALLAVAGRRQAVGSTRGDADPERRTWC